MSSSGAGMKSERPFGVEELEGEADPPTHLWIRTAARREKRDKNADRINACLQHAMGSLYPHAGRG
jgi:hypothetical protein